ncbi:MAG: zinc ribbon domain-containing protein [Dehalococcoidales bacterium]
MNTVKKFCTNCGQPLGPSAKFCAGCGAAVVSEGIVEEVTPPAAAYQPPPPVMPVQEAPPPAPPAYQPPPVPPMQAAAPPPPAPPAYQPPPYPPQQPYYGQQAVPGYGYQPPAGPIPGESVVGIIPNATKKKNLIMSDTFNIVVTNHRMVCAMLTSEMIKEESAKYRGQGVGGFFKSMGAGYNVWQRYLQISPDMALQENPANFAIYLNQIRKVKFKPDKVLFSKGGVNIGFKGGFGGLNDDNEKTTRPMEIETMSGKYKFEISDMHQQQVAETLRKAGLIK